MLQEWRPFCMRAKNRKKIVRKMVMIRAVAGFNRKKS
nr:MAG TPA: hypothetical protein [Bacteriophage sp.]